MLTVEVTDPSKDELVDPTTVVVTVTKPSKATETPTVEHVETGIYRARSSLTEVGGYLAVITTTGTFQASRPVRINVLASET